MNVVVCAVVLCPLAACTSSFRSMHITVETDVPPAAVAVRDQTSDGWRAVPSAGTSTFDLTVAGAYQVAVACVFEATGDVYIAGDARAPSDPPLVLHSCRVPTHNPSAPVVSGAMVNPGQVNLGNTGDFSITPNWSFVLRTEPGAYDLVLLDEDALGGPPRIALRRALMVTGDVDLGTIDFAQDPGLALVQTWFTTTNLPSDELLTPSLALSIGTTAAFAPTQLDLPLGHAAAVRWGASLVPDSALQATDRQIASLTASATTTIADVLRETLRVVERDVRTGETAPFTLPEPIGPVTFEMAPHRLTATWSTLGDYTGVSLEMVSVPRDSSPIRSHTLTLSRGFLDEVGTSAMLDVTEIPGFRGDWQVDTASWLVRGFGVEHAGAAGGDTRSLIVDTPVERSSAATGPVADARAWLARRHTSRDANARTLPAGSRTMISRTP